jgi:general secretion pathway protein E
MSNQREHQFASSSNRRERNSSTPKSIETDNDPVDVANKKSAENMANALADALGTVVQIDLSADRASPSFLKRFSIAEARRYEVLGFDVDRTEDNARSPDSTAIEEPATRLSPRVRLAFASLEGFANRDLVSRILASSGVTISHPAIVTTKTILTTLIDRAYSSSRGGAQQVLDSMRSGGTNSLGAETGLALGRLDAEALAQQLAIRAQSEDLLDIDGRAPIIQLVNQILLEAVMAGASDIHVQPYENRVLIRQRIDGVLFDVFEVPKAIQEEVLTRIKVLGKMNIAEKRLPLDGRATVNLGDRIVDLRIASLPTSHNERIVIRLLDKSARLYSLSDLGMSPLMLANFRRLIQRDNGLVLVTGPTGSGKSTTLYGALQEVNSTELNVLTLEDPIEYQLDGISQTQINEKKGLTFASGMRSVLRQDPDIIMIGEIRDKDTAAMAIQAALTGHLVFSTLHTNDAASAITRLLDLGVEPYLVASSVVASLAQRLVRQLCPTCKQPLSTDDSVVRDESEIDIDLVDLANLKLDELPAPFAAVGCDACRQTGFRSRLGIFELLEINDTIRDQVQQRVSAAQIRQSAIEQGMTLLAADGLRKVLMGITTIDEVQRVTTIATL